jgi:ribonuclease VapC
VIVIDSSAVVAIARQEVDASLLASAIDRDDAPQISVATILECSIVLRRARVLSVEAAESWLDDFLIDADIAIRTVTVEQAKLARDAHIRFGKGTGHPAQLNFGDCFSYALARSTNSPLLYKGSDFAKTDIKSAL